MKKILAILSLLLLWVSPSAGEERVPGDVLVVFKAEEGARVTASSLDMGRDAFRVASIATASGAWVKDTYVGLSEAGNTVFALLHSETESEDVLIEKLRARSDVVAVSPNYEVHIADTFPNDLITPSTGNGLWGLKAIGAPALWDKSTGSDNVYVAVIDTGIDYTHPDLAANVDRTYSRNFCTSDRTAYRDDAGHGTHVAGIVGAVGNNGKGVMGVNWNVRIIALKALGANGSGFISDIISAINYLVELLKADPNLNIAAVNLSLVRYDSIEPTAANLGKYPFWLALKALDRLNRTVIVAAAGNEGLEVGAPAPNSSTSGGFSKGDYAYPASFKGLNALISVAALSQDQNGGFALAKFSNYNADIAAPGVGILSTFPEAQSYTAYQIEKYTPHQLSDGTTVGTAKGTSMAAPHVAGAAALLSSAVHGLTAYQIRTALVEGQDETTVQTAATQKGLLNLTGALTYQQTHDIPSESQEYTEYDRVYDNGGSRSGGGGSGGSGGGGGSSGGGGCDALWGAGTLGAGAFLLLLLLMWIPNVRRK